MAVKRTNGTEADDEEIMDACTLGWKYLGDRIMEVRTECHNATSTLLVWWQNR